MSRDLLAVSSSRTSLARFSCSVPFNHGLSVGKLGLSGNGYVPEQRAWNHIRPLETWTWSW